jgi:cell division transport system permease protein
LSIAYILKEGFSGVKRTKISTFITIFTITLSLLVLSVFAIIFDNTSRIVHDIKNRIEIEAFLNDTLSSSQIVDLKNAILKIDGIDSLKTITKEEAALIFKQEFGEDINNVLDFNPLPSSFKISIKDEYKNSDNIKNITATLEKVNGIDDVIYRKTLLELLERRSKLFWQISLGLSIFIGIIAIILVSNTIRLVIFSKRKLILTMKLVGATDKFIRTPFILEGIIHGLSAGLISTLLLYLIMNFGIPLLGEDLFSLINVNNYFYIGVVGIGCLLGFMGSFISVLIFVNRTVKTK